MGCKALAVHLPQEVGKIGKYAFSECRSLTEIAAHKGEASEGVFASCTALKAIEIPPYCAKISDNMFLNCRALEFTCLRR